MTPFQINTLRHYVDAKITCEMCPNFENSATLADEEKRLWDAMIDKSDTPAIVALKERLAEAKNKADAAGKIRLDGYCTGYALGYYDALNEYLEFIGA